MIQKANKDNVGRLLKQWHARHRQTSAKPLSAFPHLHLAGSVPACVLLLFLIPLSTFLSQFLITCYFSARSLVSEAFSDLTTPSIYIGLHSRATSSKRSSFTDMPKIAVPALTPVTHLHS